MFLSTTPQVPCAAGHQKGRGAGGARGEGHEEDDQRGEGHREQGEGMGEGWEMIWVNYNELTTSSLEIIVSKGNHPQMALIQVSELL